MKKPVRSIILSLLISAYLLNFLCGCHGIPKGTVAETTFENIKVKATAAGLVKANQQKTTFKIKCELCGFETEDKTIRTPPLNDYYGLDWLCPNCGHKQIIYIQSFPIRNKDNLSKDNLLKADPQNIQ